MTAPLQQEEISNPHSRLIPLTDWPDYHPWPPIGGLRHLVFFENQNGFSKVVVRVGRRVLLKESEFFKWANNQKKEN